MCHAMRHVAATAWQEDHGRTRERMAAAARGHRAQQQHGKKTLQQQNDTECVCVWECVRERVCVCVNAMQCEREEANKINEN